jgi:PAS domain S-box-containing protein
LRESERRFRELLEDLQLVAIMTDLKGTITFCNDYTLAITGWSKEEVIRCHANKPMRWGSLRQWARQHPSLKAASWRRAEGAGIFNGAAFYRPVT